MEMKIYVAACNSVLMKLLNIPWQYETKFSTFAYIYNAMKAFKLQNVKLVTTTKQLYCCHNTEVNGRGENGEGGRAEGEGNPYTYRTISWK